MGGGGAKRRLGFVVVFEGDREEHDGIGRGREWERWGRGGWGAENFRPSWTAMGRYRQYEDSASH